MYHPHFDEMVQMSLGMMGMFVIHPGDGEDPAIDRDFSLMLSEWEDRARRTEARSPPDDRLQRRSR